MPQPPEEAYARGDVARGNEILNGLIAKNPGDIGLTVEALHRICIEEFLELLDADWGSLQMRRRLVRNHGGDLKKVRQVLSEHIRGALLRELEFKSDEEEYPPINTLYRATSESPINGGQAYYKYLIRESLVRRQRYPKLTPRTEWPDDAPGRLVALRRAGFAVPNHPAVVEAYALLILLRRQQERYLEAIELMDELVVGCNNDLPYLLARARLHHRIGSSRTAELFRQLFRRIGESRLDDRIQDIRQRARPYAHYLDQQPAAPRGKPQSWLAQMEPDDEQQDWAMVLRGRLNGAQRRVDRLIQQTLGDNVNLVTMPGKDGTSVAISSSVLDAHLKSLGAAQLTGLREFQEAECRNDRRTADLDAKSQAELLAVFRRYPWAKTAHRALLIYAGRELESGHGQASQRAFQDLIDHATDPRIRSKAQVGLWMAAALDGDPNKLAVAFEGIADGEEFPWMGAEATAGSIRHRLLQGMPNSESNRADAPTLASLKPQLLKIPAVRPWPDLGDRKAMGLEMIDIQPVGSKVFVSSRNILACYDMHDTERPLWAQLRRVWEHDRLQGSLGVFRPVIDGDRIYTRWGYRTHTSHLAALNATTGRVVWGTLPTEASEQVMTVPFGNPTLSGGRVYAADGRRDRRFPRNPPEL